MGLQWTIMAVAVAVEAVLSLLLTLPSPKLLKERLNAVVSLLLHPTAGVVPFAVFELIDLYWKKEHWLMCTSEVCNSGERDRYEKSIYKAQRNLILCVSACLLYWCLYCICKFHKAIKEMEEIEKHQRNL
ncbi:B-cell receptor-associated protein 29/31 [Dioscorea alata]|uniref:B-cell receptor-associated protein 29/31 n=3 Tax=Dioscorea alata TaxID=55571 RepID=A0ACB7U755_DIOAL|nr:B-cell receptor-associated protein 29/31 [Dioscorea alata]KAH7656073.1 B-cell receptor-associated protein 29/31 [Dioscorea alata]